MYFTINNITETPQAEGSRSSIAEDKNAKEKERERKRIFEFDEENNNSAAPAGFRMSSLHHYLYKLHKNEEVDLNTILTLPAATTISQKIYNECIKLLRTYKDLNPLGKSKIHCRKTIEAIIGPKQLDHVFGSKPVPPFSVYTTGCEKGLRKFVVKERSRIYENDLQEVEEFNLMVMDVYDLMLNMVTFKNWDEKHLHEEDFGCY
ncbi:hypothetical protein G6F37_007200 [Rhizopus arrhizus]|nr:hypothetical protein G6F38_009029 [Rhizopus arrhizus]KAG1156883.1 hypothetical protein G6F37_007200 [Rhizopus arrhizus]